MSDLPLSESAAPYVGRLAPSPTGALHLGNVRTFLIAWLRARQNGGRLVLRIEDLDHPRDKPGAVGALVEDLRWLGFDWDEEVVQSARKDAYAAALAELQAKGLVYPCVCSRRDVENAQSAPHAGDQLYYPGICRGRFATWAEAAAEIAPRVPCWRFNLSAWLDRHPEDAQIAIPEVFATDCPPLRPGEELGDFPLARDAGGAGYTLAVVVDDAAEGVTEVVRGDDLLPATPAQIILQHALGVPTPHYLHVPLMVGSDGRRLAKRHGDTRIFRYRQEGATPRRILGFLARTCGWDVPPEGASPRELLPVFDLRKLPHSPTQMKQNDYV